MLNPEEIESVMKKIKPFGGSLREQLEASARDSLYHFLLDYGSVRGAVLHATRLVSEMAANHELGPLETLALGQAYIAAGLMSANLKGADRLGLSIECDGPLRGLTVEANAFGEVRGYLLENPISWPRGDGRPRLEALFGEGSLSVTRTLEEARQPFTSRVKLVFGNLAQDLTHYFLQSEQVRSAFALSVSFDARQRLIGAGGLFLQAMPGAEEEVITRLDALVRDLPSLGLAFSRGLAPEAYIDENFASFSPLHLGRRRVAFMCHCSKERFSSFLAALPAEELAGMLAEESLPLVTTCLNCNSRYDFDRGELERLAAASSPPRRGQPPA
jgi:molecular chaperone Hsp33